MKTFGLALVLMLAPTFSLAMGCSHGKNTQAMSCAAGSSYDADAKACLPVSS